MISGSEEGELTVFFSKF